MQCPECGGDVLVVAVPDGLRERLSGDPTTAAVCRRCLTTAPLDGEGSEVEPADGPERTGTESETVADLSGALPADPTTALAVALFVTRCESLALNRAEIEELVSNIERAGIDPLSTLDRLAADPALDLPFDVERRRPQLVQLLR